MFFPKIVGEYQLFKEEMIIKLTESETTNKNLREEIENMIKIQQQQKQVNYTRSNKILLVLFIQ
jgi:hypothetical protein